MGGLPIFLQLPNQAIIYQEKRGYKVATTQQQIRGIEERQARKTYHCQCKQESCQEVIKPKDRYIRIKIVEITPDGYSNQERSISLQCTWWAKFKDFLI